MTPTPPRRKDLRLPDFDYATPGAYFVTICAQNRLFLFDPDPVRAMIKTWWNRLPGKFPNLETDEFVVMPNHVHGIIFIHDDNPIRVGTRHIIPVGGRHALTEPMRQILYQIEILINNDY
jgi:REP element-mobilizing transposase RayT